MNLMLLNPKVWLEIAVVGVLVAAGWFGYNWVYDRGAASVQVRWDAERAEVARQSAQIKADAAAQALSLQQAMDKQRGVTNAQVDALHAALGAAVAVLRERPERPSGGGAPNAAPAGPAPSCTGAQLFRQDGEFLAGEAARADELRLQLAECQAAYGRAVEALK